MQFSLLCGWMVSTLRHDQLRRNRLKVIKQVRDETRFHTVGDDCALTIVSLLKAYSKDKDLGKGSKLHEYIKKHAYLQDNCHIASALISMYARCGALAESQQVFDELPVPDVVTWTALIAGFAQHGQGKEALEYFDSMQRKGLSPNRVTFVCALKACGSLGAASKGEHIHKEILSWGMLDKDVMLGSILVYMYAKCGALAKARQVFDELLVRNVVTWNALLAGYAQQGQGKEALECFNSMQLEGHTSNIVTFACALKACGSIQTFVEGKQIHDNIVTLGVLEKEVVLASTLVDMYAKGGALARAQEVFDELPVRDAFTWTALIIGYTEQGQGNEALKCFDYMLREGHSPNATTFTCALKACGSRGAAA